MRNTMILLMYLSLYVPVLIIISFTPFLTKKDIVFGIKIPENKSNSKEIINFKKSYRNIVLVVSILMLIVFGFIDLYFPRETPIFATYGLFILLVVNFFIFLRFYNRMKAYKKKQKWDELTLNKTAVDTSFRKKLNLPSPLWFLLFVVIIAATVLIGFYLYDIMPDKVPMQYDFEGNVTKTVDKSYKLLLLAPLSQAFITILMVFVYWIIKKSKQQIDPDNPKNSVIRDSIFRQRWCKFTIIGGIVLLLLFGFMQLTFLGIIENAILITITPVAVAAIIVVYAIILSFKTGQGGSRIPLGKTKEGKEINKNDDKYWKLGSIYYNPDDPAIFVQKRFGVGWTNNFAHPISWVMIGGLVVIIIVFVKLSSHLSS